MSDRDRREQARGGESGRREDDELMGSFERHGEGRPTRSSRTRREPGASSRTVRRSDSSEKRSGGSSSGLYGSDTGGNVLRAAVAETVGTFILVYTGTAVAVAAILERPAVGPAFDSLSVPLAFGLVLVALVAALGHVSGAHFNPAVSLSLAVTKKFPWNYVPAYLAAQLLGAILAALATWITFGGAARAEASLAAPSLATNVGILQGFVVEALITFILVFVIISVATDDRVPGAIAPIAVGFALAAAVFIGAPVTGGSVNPARALGPIIVAWANWGTVLVYILAPIVGGTLAAVLYDRFLSDADAPE